jgi:hypothetical protein
MTITDTPTPDQITEMAYNYGTEAAHHFWQLDRPEYDHAVEWVRNADEGTLHDTYDIPSCDDCAPADFDTRGWSWLDMCLYADSWEQGYLDETTKLCRQVMAADSPQFGNETACDNCGDEWVTLNDDELCPECAEAKQ